MLSWISFPIYEPENAGSQLPMYNYLQWCKIQKSWMLPPFFLSECSICPHPQCRDPGGSSMRVIIISAAVLYACSISETGNGVPFLFPGHTSLVPLFTASAVTCRGGCSALRGQLHFRAGVAVQIANHSNSITVISWKRCSVRGVNRTGNERKAYKLLCSGPV